jgi:hypothetical protein
VLKGRILFNPAFLYYWCYMLNGSLGRKLGYIGILFGALFFFLAIPFIISLFEEADATCFDGVQNQEEVGKDCGGPCSSLCKSQVAELSVIWSRVFEVANDHYSTVAYIENPNLDAKTNFVRYRFSLIDSNGNVIAEREGNTFIPDTRIVAVFEPAFKVDGIPVTAEFEFLGESTWERDDLPIPEISVRSKKIINEERNPRLDVVIENRSPRDIPRLQVAAIIFDGKENPLGASRTFIDDLKSGEMADLVFTWPKPFAVEEKVCQIPVDVAMIVDRSGSMAAEGLNPPQPLTLVKEAGKFFTDVINVDDKVSVVSFAGSASLDSQLTFDRSSTKQIIENVSIFFDEGVQYTNTSDSLFKALTELRSSRHRSDAARAIVLLTDGESANRPLTPAGIRNDEFASALALELAKDAKGLGIEIYTIGLGEQFDGSFLETLSTTPDHFYHAPSGGVLKSIYKDIATKICKEAPTVIEIITAVPPFL